MGTDMNLLMGEIIENPEGKSKDVEELIRRFLGALMDELKLPKTPDQTSPTSPVPGSSGATISEEKTL